MQPPIDASRRIIIEKVEPQVDGGRYAVKREVGDTLEVWASVYRDGHQAVSAAVRWRTERDAEWREAPMRWVANERWFCAVPLTENARHEFRVVAWTDWFATWVSDTVKRVNAGYDVAGDLLEGVALVRAARGRARGEDRARFDACLARIEGAASRDEAVAAAVDAELARLMARWPDRHDLTETASFPVQVDRERARFSAWYELFPRSMSDDPARHGTFDDVIRKLPYVRDMGFDVLYFPPIHPIGRTARKGRNNALTAEPGDPGSPYAIGAEEGGHTAIHPQLGTLDDFRRLVAEARAHGLEVALDFAIQASPDHPYVREHPGWFHVRPDGSIKCAENPPKRYEDIYPLDFYGEDWEAHWREWRDVVLFWVAQGVKIFRVDNPHTKPVQFWEWMIREVQREHPDVIFLSEVFARPWMMDIMSKVGFAQSYTYFTWRNTRAELTEYFEELTQGEPKEYFRANLFANTPDILPEFLQLGGAPAFRIRAVLAATLSSSYGVYSGFELCENAAVPGKEEYLDSEKYEIRAWDWDRPGNIRPLITRLNQVRRENPALQEYDNLRFFDCDNDQVLFYAKATPDRRNLVFVAVSVDPFAAQEATLRFPLCAMSLAPDEPWEAEELLTGERHGWKGSEQRVRLDPESPARIFRVHAWRRAPEDPSGYEYFVDPRVSEAVRNEFVQHFRRLNPAAARAFLESSENARLITAFDGVVRPYGLGSGNISDALTALWILSWTIANGQDYPPPEHVRGARVQLGDAPLQGAAAAEKQKMAERLIYQFMFLHTDYEAARAAGDPGRLAELAAAARQAAANLGLSLDVQLTPAGFVPA